MVSVVKSPKQGAQTRRHRRTKMRDMVLLVLVQANPAHEIHLDFVGHGEAAQEILSRLRPHCCATASKGGMLSAGCE